PYADYEQTTAIIRMFSMQPEMTAALRARSIERVHSRYRFDDYGDKLIDLAESVTRTTLRKGREETAARAA
ncbi:MAG: hypothetical protein ACK53V_24690, partial [Planctomycetota bacterium]